MSCWLLCQQRLRLTDYDALQQVSLVMFTALPDVSSGSCESVKLVYVRKTGNLLFFNNYWRLNKVLTLTSPTICSKSDLVEASATKEIYFHFHRNGILESLFTFTW